MTVALWIMGIALVLGFFWICGMHDDLVEARDKRDRYKECLSIMFCLHPEVAKRLERQDSDPWNCRRLPIKAIGVVVNLEKIERLGKAWAERDKVATNGKLLDSYYTRLKEVRK